MRMHTHISIGVYGYIVSTGGIILSVVCRNNVTPTTIKPSGKRWISLHLISHVHRNISLYYWQLVSHILSLCIKLSMKSGNHGTIIVKPTITFIAKCKAFTRTRRTTTQIAKFVGPTWGLPGSCRSQMGPMLAP